jgi:hypothetical protein
MLTRRREHISAGTAASGRMVGTLFCAVLLAVVPLSPIWHICAPAQWGRGGACTATPSTSTPLHSPKASGGMGATGGRNAVWGSGKAGSAFGAQLGATGMPAWRAPPPPMPSLAIDLHLHSLGKLRQASRRGGCQSILFAPTELERCYGPNDPFYGLNLNGQSAVVVFFNDLRVLQDWTRQTPEVSNLRVIHWHVRLVMLTFQSSSAHHCSA